MDIFSPKRCKEAREYTGMSQARVAEATGINRAKLSQFENERLILTDDELIKLRDFFEEYGYGLEDDRLEPHVEDIGEFRQKLSIKEQQLSEYIQIYDGFAVPKGLEPKIVEDTLEAIRVNDQNIQKILSSVADEGFFDFSKDAAREAVRLMAKNYELVKALQGNHMLNVEKNSDEQSVTNAQLVTEIFESE